MTKFRADIQGMRAIAVMLVFVYHLFPKYLTGGYVGVDVFFVISGFLICGLILNESLRSGHFNVLNFYERRVKRLLPAASIVLIASAIGAYYFLPNTRWIETARQIIASAVYAENFYLYFQSIDYLTADTPPSPVQHYWSLSIEEQFYIVWPLLMLLAIWMYKKTSISLRKIVGLFLASIFFASLLCSIYVTQKDPAGAYFLSTTRIWELALGGLCAVILPFVKMPQKFIEPVLWLGLAMIFYTAFRYTDSTAFPGYTALLPTLGTAALLVFGSFTNHTLAQKILSLSIFRFLGDISYSLYLWHWPIIIFAQAKFGTELPVLASIAVLALAIFLSWISKVLVEDPIRKSDRNITASFLMGTGLILVSIFAALALINVSDRDSVSDTPNNAGLGEHYSAQHPGAHIFDSEYSGLTEFLDQSFLPNPSQARADIPTVYADKCHVARGETSVIPCLYVPDTDSEGQRIMRHANASEYNREIPLIMLIGDSHAAQWLPALKLIALKENWAIITHTKSSCTVIDTLLITAQGPYEDCQVWGQLIIDDVIKRRPDFVITTMITNYTVFGAKGTEDNFNKFANGLVTGWEKIAQNNIDIKVIKSTPRFEGLVPDCVAANLPEWEECNLPRSEALRFSGVLEEAASMVENADLIDMNNHLCQIDRCEVIIGNVLVYRDQHHITATYMRTMADSLYRKLQ